MQHNRVIMKYGSRMMRQKNKKERDIVTMKSIAYLQLYAIQRQKKI